MTAVEWLQEALSIHLTFEQQMQFEGLFQQAKEMENHQLECAWYSSNENMRFQFSSSAYKGITFKQWLEKFKEEK